MNPIVEMIVLDKISSFQFIAWSNDYSNQPRFHAIYKGYDVTFNAKNGDIVIVNTIGKYKNNLVTLIYFTRNWLNVYKEQVLNAIEMLHQ